MKTIMYAIDTETGHVISRVGSEVAIVGSYGNYKWTVKIPLELKNKHRVFWGMKPLKRRANSHEMTSLWKGCIFRHGGHTFTVVKVVPDAEDSNWDRVVLKDEQKRITEWNFGGMKVYLKENGDAVEHATMGAIRNQYE